MQEKRMERWGCGKPMEGTIRLTILEDHKGSCVDNGVRWARARSGSQ